ncbi:MAG: hypothetical protein WDM86_11055 [Rhizomicrobium sp.]
MTIMVGDALSQLESDRSEGPGGGDHPQFFRPTAMIGRRHGEIARSGAGCGNPAEAAGQPL